MCIYMNIFLRKQRKTIKFKLYVYCYDILKMLVKEDELFNNFGNM